jgi:hypothetical protein
MSEKTEMFNQLDKMKMPKETWTPIYSIKDLKVGFITIFKAQNDLIALRSFADDVKNVQSPLNKHPEDYEIWKIGKICLENGVIQSDVKYLGRALDYTENKTDNV